MPRYPPSRSSSLPSSQQQFPLGIRCPNPWQLYHPNIVPLFSRPLQPIRFNDSLCHSARFRRDFDGLVHTVVVAHCCCRRWYRYHRRLLGTPMGRRVVLVLRHLLLVVLLLLMLLLMLLLLCCVMIVPV